MRQSHEYEDYCTGKKSRDGTFNATPQRSGQRAQCHCIRVGFTYAYEGITQPTTKTSRQIQQETLDMQANSEVVRRFIEEVLNQGNIDAAGEFFREDMVEHVPLPGQGPGLDGLKDVLRGLRAAFPDMHWVIQEQISEGDKVLSRFEWTGTHCGPFLGVPATNRPVKVWGMVIDRLEDGKIKETRIIMDTLGLMMQLGAIASPNE
jgi:steroid delta-isomerase-like uncharacterized protein